MVARAGLGMVPRREVTLVFAALGRTLQVRWGAAARRSRVCDPDYAGDRHDSDYASGTEMELRSESDVRHVSGQEV
jgi:hypothetical protein